MLVVLVDPADVVSVPADHNAQKMRVCRLTVAARHDGEQISDAVIEHIRTVPDFEASDEYARRERNKPRPTFGVVVSFGELDDEPDGDHEYHEGDEQQGDQRCDEYVGGDEDEIVVPLGETPCMPDQWSL